MAKKIYASYMGEENENVRDTFLEFDTFEDVAMFFDISAESAQDALAKGLPHANDWFFYYEPTVTATALTKWSEVLNDARITVHKDDLDKEPTDAFKVGIMMSKHSPIRTRMYRIKISDVPCWVSQHLARHDAFAGHCVREGAQDQHFVSTSRTDRTHINRHRQGQYAPVDHAIVLNLADLMQISLRRFCHQASPETRAIWGKVVFAIGEIDPLVPRFCVPTCIHCGFCPENKCCGYVFSRMYPLNRKRYIGDYRKNMPQNGI